MGTVIALVIVDAELDRAHARITDAYWAFTRTARGRPPCLVVPDAYRDRRELQGVRRGLVRRREAP